MLTWCVELPAHSRYNPLSEGVIQAKWVPNSKHLLSNQQIRGLAQLNRLQLINFGLFTFQLQDCNVLVWVPTY